MDLHGNAKITQIVQSGAESRFTTSGTLMMRSGGFSQLLRN